MNKQKIRLKNKIFYIKDNSQYTEIPKRIYDLFVKRLEVLLLMEEQIESIKETYYEKNNNEDYDPDFPYSKEKILLAENELDGFFRGFQKNIYDFINTRTHKRYRQKAIDTLISIDSRFSKFIGR